MVTVTRVEEIRERGHRLLDGLKDVGVLTLAIKRAEAALDDMVEPGVGVEDDLNMLETYTGELRAAQAQLEGFDAAPNDYDDRDELVTNVELSIDDLADWLDALACDARLTVVSTKRQLRIFEVTDDNGTGVEIPDADGRRLISYGWTERDIYNLIAWATFYTPAQFKNIIERVEEGR